MSNQTKPTAVKKIATAPKSTTSKVSKAGLVPTWVAVVLASVLLGVAIQTHGQLGIELAGPRHPVKQYKNFHEFFPYYVQEHGEALTKVLHAVGTSIVVLFAVSRQPWLIFNTISAASIGFLLAEALAGLQGGLVEGGAMFLVYLGLNKLVLGRTYFELLVVAYGFAWVAHFFVEHNRPATFLFPSYSFMGDFYMLLQLALGRIPLQTKN